MNRILFLALSFFSYSIQAQLSDGALYTEGNELSEEDLVDSQNYYHSGRSQRIMDDACQDAEYSELCENEENAFKNGFGNTLEMMMPMVSKAWGMFSGVSGLASGGMGGLKKNISDENGAVFTRNGEDIRAVGENQYNVDGQTMTRKELSQQDGVKRKQEDKRDYCGLIPAIGEAATTAMSMIQNTNTQNQFDQSDPSNSQVNSLRAVMKSQKDRARTAGIQGGVWLGTSACYITMMATQAVAPNFSAVGKMTAASFLGSFFMIKMKHHNNRVKAIKEIINKLPSKGDCNPHSDTICFCQEKTSFQSDAQNFTRYCVPEIAQDRAPDGNWSICMRADGTPDPDCDCKKSNSCVDHNLRLAALELGLDPAMMRDAYSSLSPLSSGTGSADLEAASRRNRAMTQRMAKVADLSGIVPDKPLTKEENDQAKRLAEITGVPANVARAFMANAPQNKNLPKSFTSRGSRPTKKYSKKDKGLQFDKGPKKSRFGFKKKDQGRGKKRDKKVGAIENMDGRYAERAINSATIHKKPGVNIFDILSNRYRQSAWRKFDTLEQSNQESN